MEINKENILNENEKSKNGYSNKLKYFNTFKPNRSLSNLNFDLENENKYNYFNNKYYSYGFYLDKQNKQPLWKVKRDKIISKEIKIRNKNLFQKLTKCEYNDLLNLYLGIRKRIILIDIFFVSLLDIISVILFSSSYNLLLKNNLKLKKQINIYRIIGLIFSFITIIGLTIRRKIYKDLSVIKYILNIKLTYPSNTINFKKLLIECIIHLIQPYPFITYHKIYHRDQESDYTTIYSLDMFLVILSCLRLYTMTRLVLFSTNYRYIRIWNFYGNKNLYNIIYKKLILDSPIIFFILVLTIFLIFSSYFYSLVENIEEEEYRNTLYNCLWIVFQFSINCGYGDKKIRTFPSKIYLIILECIAIFIFSSCITACLKIFEFPTEKELKAYQKIKIIYSKNEKNNTYNIYFDHYLKYKMTKIKESLKSHKSNLTISLDKKINIALDIKSPLIHNYNNTLFRTLNLKNQLKILKDRYYLSILAKLKFEPTITDFFNYIIRRFDVKMEKINNKTHNNVNNLALFHKYFCNGITDYYHNAIEVFYDSNKVINLMQLIFWTGCQFIIKDYDELIKFKVVQLKDFDIKFKEFKLIFENRQNKHIVSLDNLKTKFYKDTELLKDIQNYQSDYDDDFDLDFDIDSEQINDFSSSNREMINNKKILNNSENQYIEEN